MRRKDREVKDLKEIIRIIEDCEILVLGLNAHQQPYLVPLNYAYEVEGLNIILYFHCALEGHKLDLIKQNNNCSFTIYKDLGIRIYKDRQSATNSYISVMGSGKVEIISEEKEKKRVAEKLLENYNVVFLKDTLTEADITKTCFAKIIVENISGKANREE